MQRNVTDFIQLFSKITKKTIEFKSIIFFIYYIILNIDIVYKLFCF